MDASYSNILRNIVENSKDEIDEINRNGFLGVAIDGEVDDKIDKTIGKFLTDLSVKQSVNIYNVSLKDIDSNDLLYLVMEE